MFARVGHFDRWRGPSGFLGRLADYSRCRLILADRGLSWRRQFGGKGCPHPDDRFAWNGQVHAGLAPADHLAAVDADRKPGDHTELQRTRPPLSVSASDEQAPRPFSSKENPSQGNWDTSALEDQCFLDLTAEAVSAPAGFP